MADLRESLTAQAAVLDEMIAAALEPKLRAVGLDLGAFELLSAIHAAGTEATQARIAQRLGITPPSFTEAIQGVVARGLVVQEAHPTDKRSKRVKLSPKGQRAFKAALDAVNIMEQTMVQGIGSNDLRVALRVLQAATRNLARESMKSSATLEE